MNYRTTVLLPRKNYTADATETIDIDLADPISQIVLTYEGLNTAANDGTAHPDTCITKVELVDGSDVLFSLSGKEIKALDFYHRGVVTPSVMYYGNDWYFEMVYVINFGRYLWDPMLAFDPKKHTNPQLKVTIDLNGGGVAPDSGYLTVFAHVFDERRIIPAGFLLQKEIKSFTLASSSHEYTDLPTDYAYRKLLVRAQRLGTGPEYQIDTIKLTEDQDKKVVLNNTMYEVIRGIACIKAPYIETIIGPTPGNTSHTFHCTPCFWPMFSASEWSASSFAADYSVYEGDGGRFKIITQGVGENFQVFAQGWAPHGVVEIPFGLQDDPSDWYDVSKIGNLKLDIKGGSSVGSSQTCEILLQQFRRY